MKSKWMILLRTLLKATSLTNIYKYTKDKKRKRQIIGNWIGFSILYICLMAYSVFMCIGYGQFGIIDAVPAMCAMLISVLAFVFTILKTNGYLFNFKEYDMLMSLPFDAKTVAMDKFLYMYIKSLPWYASISVAMLIGYGIYARPFILVYPVWIILSLMLPIIPMLVAAFFGFLIARVSAGFKKNNIIQTVLLMMFVIACFFSRFLIEALFKNDKVAQTLESISNFTDNVGEVYWPLKWFTGAVTKLNIGEILLLIGGTILLFEVVFIPVGKSYRKINSALRSHAVSRSFKMKAQRKKSLQNTIASKEFKRMTGSSTYMVNVLIGEVLAFILGVASLFVGIDELISGILQGAPISPEIIYPAIPLIVYFLIGMVSTTACSPSLEGKNYWILQSLPIETKVIYQGKMLFQMYLSVPFMVFAVLCLCISAKVSVLSMILYLLEGIALCAFSTAWGCVCGRKFMRLDWENEVEVIKQGTAVSVYLFPNMIVTLILVFAVVALGFVMDTNLVSVILTLIVSLLAVLCYKKAVSRT